MSDVLDIFYTVVGWASIPIIILSALVMVRSVGRERFLRARGLVIGIAVGVLALWLYVAILDVALLTFLSWILLLAGGVLGAFWSRSTALRRRAGGVVARRSVWYLVAWAVSLAATQALVMAGTAEMVSYGLSTVFFTTGLTLGQNGDLLVRRTLTARGAAAGAVASGSAPAATPVFCRKCGKPAHGESRFCTSCGAELDRRAS